MSISCVLKCEYEEASITSLEMRHFGETCGGHSTLLADFFYGTLLITLHINEWKSPNRWSHVPNWMTGQKLRFHQTNSRVCLYLAIDYGGSYLSVWSENYHNIELVFQSNEHTHTKYFRYWMDWSRWNWINVDSITAELMAKCVHQ